MGNAPTWPPAREAKSLSNSFPCYAGTGAPHGPHIYTPPGARAERQHAPTSLVPCPSLLHKHKQTGCAWEVSSVVGRGGP